MPSERHNMAARSRNSAQSKRPPTRSTDQYYVGSVAAYEVAIHTDQAPSILFIWLSEPIPNADPIAMAGNQNGWTVPWDLPRRTCLEPIELNYG